MARGWRRNRAALVACLGVALSLSGISAAKAETASQVDAIQQLQLLAASAGALGLYLDGSGDMVVVMPSGTANTFDLADAQSLGLSVKVAEEPLTLALLKDIQASLIGVAKATPDASYASSFDLQTGTVTLATDGSQTSLEGIAKTNPSVVIVTSAKFALMSGRNADTSPFWGGAAINDGIGGCSTGWEAVGSTTHYMVTAGHCFALGSQIRASNVSGQGYIEGNVAQRDYPAYDGELISGTSYAPYMYDGAAGDNTSRVAIYGRSLDVTGTSGICRTGWKTGNSCGWTLTDVNGTFCYQGNCTTDMNEYQGGSSPQPGDSGGPIYIPYNGGAILSGTITGSECTIFGCVWFGEKIGTILGRWNLTQVCSGTCQLR